MCSTALSKRIARGVLLAGLIAATHACSDGAPSARQDAWVPLPYPEAGTPPGSDGWTPPAASDAGIPPAPPEAGIPPAPDAASGPCPALMALVDGTFCIDIYEAALQEQLAGGGWQPASPYLTVGGRTVRAVPAAGMVPQGYISGVEAQAACAAAGKRLCSSAEWLAACRGPASNIWPYGNTHQAGACNDDYQGHPVVKLFGTSSGIWDGQHMNDPRINQQPGTVAAGGEHLSCVSHWGVYDMHGNLHEWVSDAAGTFRGGFYVDGSINGNGCTYATTAHASDYHDYSTGFRCCSDPAPHP